MNTCGIFEDLEPGDEHHFLDNKSKTLIEEIKIFGGFCMGVFKNPGYAYYICNLTHVLAKTNNYNDSNFLINKFLPNGVEKLRAYRKHTNM